MSYTPFHLSAEMDDFFMKAKEQSDSQLVTHSITDVTNIGIDYKCILAYGSNNNYASTEALSYLLNFYSELYMITRVKNKSNNKYSNILNRCIAYITYVLNTIIAIYIFKKTNITSEYDYNDQYVNVMFPMWKYNVVNKAIIQPDGPNTTYASAQDSNQEILKSLLKLYIFERNDNYLKHINYTIMPADAFFDVTISSSDTLPDTIKKIIVLMSHNVMYGNQHATDHWQGNFQNTSSDTAQAAGIQSSTTSDVGISFTIACGGTPNQNPNIQITGNIIDSKIADYVNFSLFIYLYKFFSIFGNANTPENLTIASIAGSGSTTNLPSWAHAKIAISNYIQYIYHYTSPVDWTYLSSPYDDPFATISRLAYQHIHLQILLTKGDTRLGISATDCNNAYLAFSSKPTTMIKDICTRLIQYEIDQDVLYLETTSLAGGGSLQYPVNYPTANHEHNPSFYYRQLAYMCFKILNTITFTSTRSNSTNIKYFENSSDFEYFGIGVDNTNSFQKLINEYSYTTFKNFEVEGFGSGDNTNIKNWLNGVSQSWLNNNNPYFNFSLCSLHQMIYYLYNEI